MSHSRSFRIVTVIAVHAVLGALAACSKAPSEPVDKSIWIQQSEIAIKTAGLDIRACAVKAIEKIPGLKVDEAASSADLLSLSTPLAKTVPGVHIEIIRTDHDAIDVQFIGHGSREPNEARIAISPVLRELSNAVSAACKPGK